MRDFSIPPQNRRQQSSSGLLSSQ